MVNIEMLYNLTRQKQIEYILQSLRSQQIRLVMQAGYQAVWN